MKKSVRYLSLLISFCFLIFAAVQWNDVDWFLWIPIYLLPAGLCLLTYFNKEKPVLNLAVSVFYFLGAIYLWPQEYKGVFFDMRYAPEIELARESLGLGICVIALALSSLNSLFQERPLNKKEKELVS